MFVLEKYCSNLFEHDVPFLYIFTKGSNKFKGILKDYLNITCSLILLYCDCNRFQHSLQSCEVIVTGNYTK